MRTAFDWLSYFGNVSKHLFASLQRRVVFQPDGSGSPVAMALRDAVLAFPFATKILFLDTKDSVPARSGDRIWTLLRFDLSAPKTPTFKELGTVSVIHFGKLAPLLRREFGLSDQDWESLSSMLGNWDGPLVGHLAEFDIRASAERYAFELAQFLFDGTDRVVALFGRAVDFNAKYGLKPDAILSTRSLLQVDSLTALFGDSSKRHLRRLQAEVASIELISFPIVGAIGAYPVSLGRPSREGSLSTPAALFAHDGGAKSPRARCIKSRLASSAFRMNHDACESSHLLTTPTKP
jgi:hypothetical protein